MEDINTEEIGTSCSHLSFVISSSKPGHSPSLEGGRWSVGDDHQSLRLEREDWESESGEDRRKHKKRPRKCRAVGENLNAHEPVGGLTEAPHEHGKGLTGCGRFRQALSAHLCLGFFLIQKLVPLLSCCCPCLLRSYLHHERNCDAFGGIVGTFA
jgi:hypothetical protein